MADPKAISTAQMKVLRLLDAGARLLDPKNGEARYRLVLPPSSTTIRYVSARIVHELAHSRMLARTDRGDRYQITQYARDRIAVRVVVSQFAASLTSSI